MIDAGFSLTYTLIHICLISADNEGLFHLLTRDDLYYNHGKNDGKTSNPMAILKKHAVHLFHGGFGDVTGDEKLKNYSVMMYCRDSKGHKMLLKTSRLNGRVRDNLEDVIDACAENEIKQIVMKVPMNPKQITRAEKCGKTIPKDGVKNMTLKPKQLTRLERFGVPVPVSCAKARTLWIEAKVVPKKDQTGQFEGEKVVEKETVEMSEDDDSVDAPTGPLDKNEDWDVLVGATAT
jgi:hypothetical protein